MILDRIIKTKKEEVERLKKDMPLADLQAVVDGIGPCRNFRTAISGKSCAIIAEVKCASPSRGRIAEDFDPVRIAAEYEKNNAAAISVLTDEKYFSGHKKYLTKIRSVVKLPLLRKDFIIDSYQVYESRAIGADAVLLIVCVVGERLGEFITLSREMGLAVLTEVHTDAELKIALAAGADIIGINNRSLATFITDINTCKKLAHLVPAGNIIVAESAITCRADIENITQAGISAFLIGEALVTAGDIGKKMRELRGD